jgi:type IV pilus assembly protein PilV
MQPMDDIYQAARLHEQGFTLVEGMLASVILAVGLLGLSGMQSIALVKNVDANETTKVTSLAADMMERIQFNRRNAASYQGIDTTSASSCTAISASAQPMANGDCTLWSTLVNNTQLQNIRGTVAVSPALVGPAALNQRNVTVTITWLGSLRSDQTVKRSRTLTLQRVVAPE